MLHRLTNLLRTVVLLGLGGLVFPVLASAEWISLYSPKQSTLASAEVAGQQAFNALGCGECHSNMAAPAYKSGFRVLPEAVMGDLGQRMEPAHSPLVRAFTDAWVADAILSVRPDTENYLPSGRYSGVYLLRVHQGVPGVEASMNQYELADDLLQVQASEYMLLF